MADIAIDTEVTLSAAQALKQAAQMLEDGIAQAQRAAQGMYSGGNDGAYMDAFEQDRAALDQQLKTTSARVQEVAQDLERTVETFRGQDVTNAGYFEAGGGNGFSGFSGGGGGGGSSGAWGFEIKGVKDRDFPYHLVHGRSAKAYFGFLRKEMTLKEAVDYINEDPFAPKISDYVDFKAEAELFKKEMSGEIYVERFEGSTTFGEDGHIGGKLTFGEISGDVTSSLSLTEDGIKAEIDARAGAYIGKFEANAEYGGFSAGADGYVGAEATGKADVVIDPFTGNVSASAEGEVFVGAKVEGQASHDFGFVKVGVQGEAMAGAGAGGKFDLGISDNKFKLDMSAFGAVGVGGGAGVVVEVDLKEVGEGLKQAADAGVAFLDGLF